MKLTGSAAKWQGRTYYETPQSGSGGRHYDWIRNDEMQLQRK
ncbi:hypothetical protein [Streptomyces sp. NPDC002209]